MGTDENYLEDYISKEERSCPRVKCNYETNCWDDYENRWTCRIVDMSERGLGIIMSASLRGGDIINITDPRTKAKVVWVEKSRIGLRVCY